MPQLGVPHGGIIRPSRRPSPTPTDVTATPRTARTDVEAVGEKATIEREAYDGGALRQGSFNAAAAKNRGPRQKNVVISVNYAGRKTSRPDMYGSSAFGSVTEPSAF